MARNAGDISSLFPEGVTRLADLPFTIFNLIANSLFFVSFDEMPKEDRPPKSIWLDSDRMEQHWAALDAKRRDKEQGRADTSKMPRNALIDQLVVGR